MRGQARRSKGTSRELKEGDYADGKRPYFAPYVSLVRVQQGEPIITDNIDIVSNRTAVAGFFDAFTAISKKGGSVDIFEPFRENA